MSAKIPVALEENTNTAKQTRLSNFELLRIISMLLIVSHHYSIHGGFQFGSEVSANKLIVDFLFFGGKLGVNCFVLITGYFSTQIFQIKWNTLVKFLVQTTIFSVVITGISFLAGDEKFTIYNLIRSLLPINYNLWWFSSTYFVLLLLIPFINLGIKNMTQKTHLQLILILFIIWSVMGTVGLGSFERSNLTWFIFLYIIAAYIYI